MKKRGTSSQTTMECVHEKKVTHQCGFFFIGSVVECRGAVGGDLGFWKFPRGVVQCLGARVVGINSARNIARASSNHRAQIRKCLLGKLNACSPPPRTHPGLPVATPPQSNPPNCFPPFSRSRGNRFVYRVIEQNFRNDRKKSYRQNKYCNECERRIVDFIVDCTRVANTSKFN